MLRRRVGWAVGVILLMLVVGARWLLNIYAPPPGAVAFQERASPKSLNYEWVGSSVMEPYDTGALRLRNTDKATWTQIDIEIAVYALPGNRRFQFKCPSPATVPPGQILTVPFQACAHPLPGDVESALFRTLSIQTREGHVVGAGFEPGYVIVPQGQTLR
jgi:hypothetical protein